MIRTGRDDGRGLVAAYREEMGFAAIAIVGGPAGTRVFAVVPGDAEAKAAAEAAQARWWCRHAADAERIAAAAARRLGREAKAAAGGQADTSAAFSLAGAAVRAAAKRFAIALQADAEIAEEAMAVAARIDAEQLCALQQIDGATIKRVIDDWGRTPLPFSGADGATIYPPAYQQVLKGLPAVNYSARDIIYRPRNVRAHRVYGYSPVQQVLMTVNIALRRQLWQLDYYSEGSIPDALIGVPQGWTPDQIKQFQDYWDTEFAGDLAKRRRAKFVPGEAAAKVVQTKEPEQKNDFDEWLARIICYAFSVPPQWATKVMNRATADNQSEQAEDEGLEPTKEWVKDLVDEIIAEEFASPDLELAWLDEDEGDPKGLEAVLEGRVKLGAVTLNEMRDALGLDPFANPAADRPMVLIATGYVPIEANAGAEAAKPHGADAQTAGVVQKYSSNQPRVPAGNADGGQWTSDGGDEPGDLTESSGDRADAVPGDSQPSEAPVNDPRAVSDATPDNTWIPGAQYAGGIEDGEGENRIGGEPFEATPAQQARLAVAEGFWRDAISRVQALGPNWKPTPGIYETVEGQIADLEAQTQEAQNRLSELASFGIGPGPFAGESIPARGPSRDFTDDERAEINSIGAETGCHTCGTTEPGTSLGNFVADHQLPSALNPAGQAQRLYPQCISCSWLQGGWVRYLNRTR